LGRAVGSYVRANQVPWVDWEDRVNEPVIGRTSH
jgi:hypothetical protein